MKFSSCALLAGLAASAAGLDADGWSKQTVYQLMTDRFARQDGSTTAECSDQDGQYCGGSFQGIINKLDYIQGMGFTAIWISPVVANIEDSTSEGQAYHGYWAQKINSINSHFGTGDDLKALASALHDKGMYLMVDIVTNHMGYSGCGTCVDYSNYDVFNDSTKFHDFCLIDYSDPTSSNIQTCWEGDNTVALPDIRTEDDDVRNIWFSWVKKLVSDYSIDGLRIDSAHQVEKSFHAPFESAAGVYTIGEVFVGDPAYTLPYQQVMSGVLNYPQYFWLKRAFGSTDGDFSELSAGINTIKADAVNSSYLGSFMENHDNDRFPTVTSDAALNRNGMAFNMLNDGIPFVFQGQEQFFNGTDVTGRRALWPSGYDTTTEWYRLIAKLNQVRNHAVATDPGFIPYQAWVPYTSGGVMLLRKGSDGSQILAVLSKTGAGAGDATVTLQQSATGLDANQDVIEIINCNTATTDGSGNLSVTVSGGNPLVFYPKSKTAGSGICS